MTHICLVSTDNKESPPRTICLYYFSCFSVNQCFQINFGVEYTEQSSRFQCLCLENGFSCFSVGDFLDFKCEVICRFYFIQCYLQRFIRKDDYLDRKSTRL